MEGSTWKSIEYSSNFAKVKGNKKTVGVLCQWYDVDQKRHLLPLNVEVHGYIPIDSYKLTLPLPIMSDCSLHLDSNVFSKIRKQLKVILKKKKAKKS